MKKVFLAMMMVLLSASFAWGSVIKETQEFFNIIVNDPNGDVHSGVSASGVSVAGNAAIEGDLAVTGQVNLGDALYTSGVSELPVADVGWTFQGDEGNTFYLDASSPGISLSGTSQTGGSNVGPLSTSGVTVNLPVPSATLHGWTALFIKIDSGATDIYLCVSGSTTAGAAYENIFHGGDGQSGTTSGDLYTAGTCDLDGLYDRIAVECYYFSSGNSGYIVTECVIDGSHL